VLAVGPDGVAPVPGGLDGWLARLAAPSGRSDSRAGAVSRSPSIGPSEGAPTPDGRPAAKSGTATPPTGGTPPGRGSAAPPIGRRLREIEKEMNRLGRQRDRLHDALVGATDHVELHRLGAELRAVQVDLDAAEEQWLVLAEQAEDR